MSDASRLALDEDAIIAAVGGLSRRLRSDGMVAGIGDDAAVLAPPTGREIVACVDTLNEGVHFAAGVAPERLGHKALAVNLSDLAAMGAAPHWVLLSLSLNEPTRAWLDAFMQGFGALAERHGVGLAGGDTTRGRLAVSVTALGSVPTGGALRRGTGRAGDTIWVSGTLGDAALALELGEAAPADLRDRLELPEPRLHLGRGLRTLASSCIDLSDGLRRDLPRLLPDGAGARIELARLPRSAALRKHAPGEAALLLPAIGGDDYELCFTAPPTAARSIAELGDALALGLTPVGEVTHSGEVLYLDAEGAEVDLQVHPGFEHFPAPGQPAQSSDSGGASGR